MSRFVLLPVLVILVASPVLKLSAQLLQKTTLSAELANNTSACTVDAAHPYCTQAFTALADKNGSAIETLYPDAAPGHISPVSLSSTVAPTLMYSGFNGQFICMYQPWFGLSSHINVGYNETNSATTDAQANAMKAAGCNIGFVSFYGTTETGLVSDFAFDLTASSTLYNSVSKVSGLKFGILEVDQAFSGSTVTQIKNGTQGNCNQFGPTDTADTIVCIEGALNADVLYIYNTYVAPGSAYWRNGSPNAEPVVGLFGSLCDFPALSYGDSGSCPVPNGNGINNWNTIWTEVQSYANSLYSPGFKFIFQYGAFERPTVSAGEFAWPQPVTWDLKNGSVSTGSQYWWCNPAGFACPSGYLYDFYYAGTQNSTDLTVGLLEKGFDDSNASWGRSPYRITSQECGQIILDTAAYPSVTTGFFGKNNQIPYMQIATWNDYEEGTAVEAGLDDCYTVSASLSGSALNWSLASSDLYGYASTSTIHHFNIWYGAIGNNLNKTITLGATNIANTRTSYNLPQLAGLSGHGTVDLYLEMVGMPLVQNKMSPAVVYTY